MNTAPKQIPQSRWLKTIRKISVKEARQTRSQNVQHLREMIKGMKRELREMKKAPLATEGVDYREVFPGEPGYEEASVRFDPDCYEGKFKWLGSK